MNEININLSNCIIKCFRNTHEDIMHHDHVHYVFPGGRGSTKSSFISIEIPLLIINNPQIHACCFRKVGNTIQNSIKAQIEWGIHKLGLQDLFIIPKAYSNPIIYRPTGQCIYFLGLDNPQKVKSIKPKFGYIGITWFEELDQFAGENEIRTVTQSTMRGGDVFWDFRSFNPPISKNNWANAYADKMETKSNNTRVIRNTYLDVPPLWLGQPFFDEAEELKAINPRAYEHEYLGVATGTGGDVFANACDLDMSQMVAVEPYKEGNQIITEKPMWQTFDKIYNGIDWGFARDPFRFVRMHFDPKHLDLYIFREYNTLKKRNETVFHELYDELELVDRAEAVIADSAEEKSVADFKAYGAFIRPAEKGPESVRYGIKWLQGLNHIYIDRNACPYTWKEFSNYEYEQDKDGNFISAYPDKDNHSIDACRYALQKWWARKGN